MSLILMSFVRRGKKLLSVVNSMLFPCKKWIIFASSYIQVVSMWMGIICYKSETLKLLSKALK